MSTVIKALAIEAVIAACASVAFAQTPPREPYYPADPTLPAYPAAPEGSYYSGIGSNFTVAPYGYANPFYGSYRERLRSDFNRGVDYPGR
jgi:hypothetical protein